MGWKKGAAAGAAAGAWAGPLGMLIGAAIGGATQKAVSASLDNNGNGLSLTGLSLCSGCYSIEWANIASAECCGDTWNFICRGGLRLECGGVANALANLDVSQLAKFDIDRAFATVFPSSESIAEYNVAMLAEDLLWAIDMANALKELDDVSVDEEFIFRACSMMAACLCDRESEDKNARVLLEPIRKGLRSRFAEIDSLLPSVSDVVDLALFALSSDDCGGSVSQQKARYEELSTAHKCSSDDSQDDDPIEGRKESIAPLLLADGNGEALGAAGWYNERKTLICTDKPMDLKTFARKRRLDGIMVMDAADVELYNDSITEPSLKLEFQSGHPQNGCTYIQHPHRKNRYYEVNSFHDSILERKQNELLRIFESLGAYSARVEIRHEQQTASDFARESHLDAKASLRNVSGEVSRTANAEQTSTLLASQRATKDWTFNPPEKPSLPDDLVFYRDEETWQQLASSVLRGGLKRAEVDLEYKSEYGITEKYLSDVSVSAKSVIPSFQMNLKQGFSSKLHQLTTTKWHYIVEFENESGERAGARIAQTTAAETPALTVGDNKVEALFMKRARRYAQSDEHINATQRADLEALAKKYGIDDFRMEELIEEAFV